MVDQGDGDEDPVASLATGRVPVGNSSRIILEAFSGGGGHEMWLSDA